MKAVKTPKPIAVWKKERLDLILSQRAKPMPRMRTSFYKVKHQEFTAACVWLKSIGSAAKALIDIKQSIVTRVKKKY